MEINNDNVFEQCPCCGSTSFKDLGDLTMPRQTKLSTTDIELQRKPYLQFCKNCKSSFVQNSVRKEDAEWLYSSGDGTKRWTGVEFKKDKPEAVVRYLQSMIKKDVTVCDIGCNTGEFLTFAKDLGAKTFGVELSTSSSDFCQRLGHKVKTRIDEFDQKFNLITAFDLVEHLYDPIIFIEKLSKHLKIGGFLVFLTGNSNSIPANTLKSKWWYVNYPEHVVFPSKRFYEGVKNFELVKYDKTYASSGYQNQGNDIRYAAKLFLTRDYTGRPSYFSDHHLITLKRIK